VVLDLAQTGRRIEGDRDGASHLRAEEGGEVVERGGEHEPHGLPGADAQVLEARGHGPGAPRQLAEAQLLGLAVPGVVEDVPPFRMALDMPVEHLQESPRALGSGLGRCQRLVQNCRREARHTRRPGKQGAEQVPRSLRRGQQRFREPDPEGPFQPEEQLGPGQAVEPEVALQGRIKGCAVETPPSGVQLPRERADEAENFLGGPRRGLGCHWGESILPLTP
jgi:hypothetical protein